MEDAKVLEKIAEAIEKQNTLIESMVSVIKSEASRQKEHENNSVPAEMTPLATSKEWILSALDDIIVDIGRNFASDVAKIDRLTDKREYDQKLLVTLKSIRAVLNLRNQIETALSKEGLEEAIAKLESEKISDQSGSEAL